MFHTLLESRALPAARRRRWTVASVGVHAAIVTLVVAKTVRPEALATPVAHEPLVFAAIRDASPPPAAETAASPPNAPPPPHALIPRIPAVPVIDASVAPNSALFAVEILRDAPALNPAGGIVAGSVLTAGHVDREVMPLAGNGQPAYPPALRAASVEGEVIVRFVVDTVGRLEPGSIGILAATHPLFADAVADWLRRTRYAPAEYGGGRVRQLVEQRIAFSLRR